MTKFLEPRMFFGPPRMKPEPKPDCPHNRGAVFNGTRWICKLCKSVIRDKKKVPKDRT